MITAIKRLFFGNKSNTNVKPKDFQNSKDYWETRYSIGGNSGSGSYNRLADFKAEILNNFISENQIQTIIEFGSGDGNQLKLAKYPQYLGFDVSQTAVEKCRQLFINDKTKSFETVGAFKDQKADLSLSLDVIYHLVEDEVFENYMRSVFSSSSRFVIFYNSNTDDNSKNKAKHVKHRKFTDWIEKNIRDWALVKFIPNRYPFNGDNESSSFSDFYIFQKND